ncbi:MAG TPA: DNA-binding response regulator [Sutterella sp.]|nr:DNA-binding response regulator [Sutterella sp.]
MTVPLIRVVDDSASVRASLEFLLQCEGWETAGFASAESFLAGDTPSRPGCLVLDVSMPGRSGLELQEILLARASRLPIIFLTGTGTVDMAVKTLQDGAFDFLQKPVDPARLLPAVARAVEESLRRTGHAHGREEQKALLARLTARELEILRLVASGLTSRQIAERLDLSKRTVEHYRAGAQRKIGCTEAAQVALFLSQSDEDSGGAR